MWSAGHPAPPPPQAWGLEHTILSPAGGRVSDGCGAYLRWSLERSGWGWGGAWSQSLSSLCSLVSGVMHFCHHALPTTMTLSPPTVSRKNSFPLKLLFIRHLITAVRKVTHTHTVTHINTLTHRHTHSDTHSHKHIHTQTQSHINTFTLTHITHTHSPKCSYTHTHIHTHR